jgi:hypothetical protein
VLVGEGQEFFDAIAKHQFSPGRSFFDTSDVERRVAKDLVGSVLPQVLRVSKPCKVFKIIT